MGAIRENHTRRGTCVSEAIQRRLIWLVVGPHSIKETLKPLVVGIDDGHASEIAEAIRLADDMSRTVSELWQLLPEAFLPTMETILGLGSDLGTEERAVDGS